MPRVRPWFDLRVPAARRQLPVASFLIGFGLCLALLALAAPHRVAAMGAEGALKAVPAAAAIVEPAQVRRRPRLGKKKLRRPPGGLKRKPLSGRPTHKPPRRTPDEAETPPPKVAKHPRRPRLPPIVLMPGLPPDQAELLHALPRRIEEPPRAPLQRRAAREILVLVDQSGPQSLDAELAQAHGLDLISSRPLALLDARAVLFRLRPGRSEAVALAALRRDRRVRSAQRNWLYSHSGGEKGAASLIPQYGPKKVQLPEAHKLALGRTVTVAVIDSQVDLEHPDLEGAVVRTFDAVGDATVDGAGAAPDFHGTAVAGIIGSRGVVEAVAPQAAILAVRAFRTKTGALPETTSYILLGAIDWAAGNGARVLNMSFVGPRDKSLEDLLGAASRKGLILVAAAGNAGPKAPPAYPAAYPGVIAVTAVDAADRRYRHANRGRYIAIAAPGVDVLAPVDGGGHELLSGTSFATAYVSGIAALLLERNPSLDPAAVARLVAAAADDLGPAGRDDDFGAGRVNALAALRSVPAFASR